MKRLNREKKKRLGENISSHLILISDHGDGSCVDTGENERPGKGNEINLTKM